MNSVHFPVTSWERWLGVKNSEILHVWKSILFYPDTWLIICLDSILDSRWTIFYPQNMAGMSPLPCRFECYCHHPGLQVFVCNVFSSFSSSFSLETLSYICSSKTKKITPSCLSLFFMESLCRVLYSTLNVKTHFL